MKKILLNWYYHRPDLTEYLLPFQGEFEFVFIYYHEQYEVPSYLREQPHVSVIYWGDFSSPYRLLEQVAPQLVVFADIESFNQLALNIASRNRGIHTVVLQHGLRGSFEVDEALAASVASSQPVSFSKTTSWSIRFLLSSLRLKNLFSLPRLAGFAYARKTKDLTTSLFHHQFELRRADHYIEFSEENAGYHRTRDGVQANRFIYTGIPVFDDYFRYLNEPGNHGADYCLLIDCPFGETFFYSDHGMTLEKKNNYLQKLANWSGVNGFPLKVKLHPLSYKLEGLVENTLISYVRETDMKELIGRAAFVFFVHFSTLTPVILNYKPAVYFHSGLESHSAQFRELGAKVEFLFDFDDQQPDLVSKACMVHQKRLMPILYTTDGQAAQRVKQAFADLS